MRQDEEALSKIVLDTLAEDIFSYENNHIRTLLCRLDTLPWRRSYSCELAMNKFEITVNFQRMSRNRADRFHRDLVLLDYLSRTLSNIKKIFLCLSKGIKCFARIRQERTILKKWG